jgi:Peptidase family M28
VTESHNYGQIALGHIQHIMRTIGGRASCSPEERQAAEYVAGQLTQLGVSQVRLESFQGAISTYWPPMIAFGTALVGVLAALLFNNRWAMVLGALLNTVAVWGFWTELDLNPNWLRRFTPTGASQNAIGVILPVQEVQCRTVICAHLDTHRAPVLASTPTWQRLFNILLLLTFLSMVLSAAAFTLGFLFNLGSIRWVGLATMPLLVFALAMSIQARGAPVSPGANDNTSAVGVALALAEKLAAEPPAHTEVWLVFTGCEEVGAYGMFAFLDAHAEELGAETEYLVLEQVGTGSLQLVTAEGLVIKRPIRSEALLLGRQAGAALPAIGLTEKVGEAYSDALPAIKRGLVAFTITSAPASIGEVSHWHQMSDTVEHIYPETLQQAFDLALEIVQQADRLKGDSSGKG